MLVDKHYCFQWSLQLSIPQKKLGSFIPLHGSSCSTLTGRELFQRDFFLKLKATSAFPRPNLLEISSEPTIDFQAGELLVLGSFFFVKIQGRYC